MTSWQTISDHIAESTGKPFRLRKRQDVGGGCINTAHRIEADDGRRLFIKLNQARLLPMFEAEAEGLQAMLDTKTLLIPTPVCHGTAGSQAYLVMEHLDIGPGNAQTATTLGRQLAAMHRAQQPHFGWHRDNTIGSTPQPNSPSNDWIGFWRDQRLGFQLELAAGKGYQGRLQRQGARLMAQLDQLLDGHRPTPSLLHGDLWSGNYGSIADGRPVIFDPACYYGDREADLAMTELFGGFPTDFYQAYRQAWPLDQGYPRRRTLYNLYHILNHLNLFGGGYGTQAERMIDALLSG